MKLEIVQVEHCIFFSFEKRSPLTADLLSLKCQKCSSSNLSHGIIELDMGVTITRSVDQKFSMHAFSPNPL